MTGSVSDSVLDVKDYVRKAKALGLTHIALTDRGSMAAMIDFHEACKEAFITGIIGMEAYIVADRLNHSAEARHTEHHLVLLAKNKEGVKNLLRIHNDAHINGYYERAKTDMSMLKKYGKNLIGLSACVGGEIPQLLLAGDLSGAEKRLAEYKDALDEFYLEIQPGHFDTQAEVNKRILYLAYKTKTPFVATNDIHYLNAEDWAMHDAHIKDRNPKGYPDSCYYLMSEKELNESFTRSGIITDKVVAMAIENTNRIAAQCDGEVEYNFEMPKYLDLPEGETEASYLTKLCYEALDKKRSEIADPVKYAERLEYELDTIQKLGFCGYFLIVNDLLEYARANDVAVGPGRGSVGGSLVAYLLRITVADPVKYNLVFERFLSPNRVSLPDIDIDFSDAPKMKDYVIAKYGKEHCALVGTFGIRKAKAALKAAGRVLGIDLQIVDSVCKAVPYKVPGDNGESAIDNPTISQMLNVSQALRDKQAAYPQLFEKAILMESYPQCTGIHAAGIVISPHNLLEYMPIRVDPKTGRYVSYLSKNCIEKVALKYDFLALATQAIVDKTVKDVGINIDLEDDAFFTDAKVWDAIDTKYTTGMFQISSSLYKARMPRLKPRSLQELADCIALVRGPCISAGTDETYMQITEGNAVVQKIDPRYDAITASTKGVTVYQEQVMQLGTAFGLDLDSSYKLLKAISKKHLDKVRPMREIIWNKAHEMGVPPEATTKVWKAIEDAAKYSFNQAHAISYAIIGYLSAYLKVYYPAHFMANLLTNAYVNGKSNKFKAEAVADCHRMGLQFLNVDINKSDWGFKVEDGKIRIGLCAIKAFGESAMQVLTPSRPYNSFSDFIKMCKENKNGMNKTRGTVLIAAGALDCFGNRVEHMQEFFKFKGAKFKKSDKLSVCTGCQVSLSESKAALERKLLGAVMCNSPTAQAGGIKFSDIAIGTVFKGTVYLEGVKEIIDKRGQQMAFVDLAANDGLFRGVIFGSIYPNLKPIIKEGSVIKIQAKKDKEGSCIISDAA